jgi:glycosyltransferase involved in cell wall biosynthesis
MSDSLTLHAIYPIYCSGKAITHCLLSLCDHINSPEIRIDYWAPAAAPEINRSYLHTAVPHSISRILYHLDRSGGLINSLLYRRYRKVFKEGDIAYIWPGVPVEVFKKLKDKGFIIVLERVNSNQQRAKNILSKAYASLGWPYRYRVTDKAIADEEEKLELSDWIYCPSPFVTESFVEAGVPRTKILESSYGWDPDTFRVNTDRSEERHTVTFLFVASGDVRKGLPWLLRYWNRADIKGRLVVTGTIESDVNEYCGDLLQSDNVTHIPFTSDLVPIYESADVFVLPSHEEGSPLVTYLAAASGLPCIVSPAGSGGVVRHNVEGFICDTYDEDAWINHMRMLAEDRDMRNRMGAASLKRSEEYTWKNVALKRRRQLLRIFDSGKG